MKHPGIVTVDPAREYLSAERCHILEIGNDPQDPAVSIARARVRPGVCTRTHRLRATAERYLIEAGEGEVRVGDLRRRVAPGDLVRIPPGQPQSIRNTGNDDLVFLCICTPRFEWQCYEDLE